MGTRGPAKTFDRKKTINFSDDLLARIEAFRLAEGLTSEAEAIRVLLSEALAAREPPKKRKR